MRCYFWTLVETNIFIRPVEDSMTGNSPGYAVGWGTLAMINAGLAQGKGRRGLVWFFVSLLLGPLATLLIVVLNPK